MLHGENLVRMDLALHDLLLKYARLMVEPRKMNQLEETPRKDEKIHSRMQRRKVACSSWA